jgi:hypothetical protein
MFKFSDDNGLWCGHFCPSGHDVNNLNRDLLNNDTLIKYLSCSFLGDEVDNFYALRKISGEHIVGALSVCTSVVLSGA